MANKKTSDEIAKIASKILKDDSYSETSKSVAGSVLSQTNTKKGTSKDISEKASKVLRDDRFSKESKSAARSALSQAKKNKK